MYDIVCNLTPPVTATSIDHLAVAGLIAMLILAVVMLIRDVAQHIDEWDD